MKHLITATVLLSLVASASAAEGRHTATVGGFLAGIVAALVVEDVVHAEQPAERVVVVEQPVVVERVIIIDDDRCSHREHRRSDRRCDRRDR